MVQNGQKLCDGADKDIKFQVYFIYIAYLKQPQDWPKCFTKEAASKLKPDNQRLIKLKDIPRECMWLSSGAFKGD